MQNKRKINFNEGDIIGDLIFINEFYLLNKKGHKVRHAMCQCKCGIIKKFLLKNLYTGNTKNCGCDRSNLLASLVKYKEFDKRLYRIFHGIKSRCYEINNPAYKRYGGRGISMCEDWLNDFMSFYRWAKDNGYSEHLTIDRIDNDGDYRPDNCRWVDRKVQANNTRGNLKVLLDGELLTLSNACEKVGLNKNQYKKVSWRMKNSGIDFPEAIKFYLK